jgi:hypothetical protein
LEAPLRRHGILDFERPITSENAPGNAGTHFVLNQAARQPPTSDDITARMTRYIRCQFRNSICLELNLVPSRLLISPRPKWISRLDNERQWVLSNGLLCSLSRLANQTTTKLQRGENDSSRRSKYG